MIGFAVMGLALIVLIVAVAMFADAVAKRDAQRLASAHKRYHQRREEAMWAAVIRGLEDDDDAE